MISEEYLNHLNKDPRNQITFTALWGYVRGLSKIDAEGFKRIVTNILEEGEKLWNLRRKKI